MTVVEFKRPGQPRKDDSQYVFVCGCGCASFSLRGDGEAVCRGCGSLVDTAINPHWYKLEGDIVTQDVTFADGGNGPENSFAEMSAKRNAQLGTTTWIICGDNSGTVRSWSRAWLESPEQKLWMQRQVEAGVGEMLKDKPE